MIHRRDFLELVAIVGASSLFGSVVSVPSLAFAKDEVYDGACLDYSDVSQSEVEKLLQRQAELDAAGIISGAELLDDERGFRRGRPRYDTVYGASVQSSTGLRDVSGQPSGGYSFGSAGGAVYIALSGGPNLSISFGFPAPWNRVSVGVSFGKIVPVSGIMVNIPGDGMHYKVRLNNTYASKPFTVYKTDPRGVRTVYRRSHTTPVLVSKDFRAYRA